MSICVFQTEDLDELSEVQQYLKQLKELEDVQIEYFHQSAVAGELAGTTVEILMSKEVQVALSTIAVGQILWQLIGALKKLGKKFSISQNVAKRIALFKTNETIESDGEKNEVSDYLVYGPMTAELDIELSSLCANEDTDSDEIYFDTCFLAVVFPRPKQRIKTIWYLFQHTGEILASWSTQTYACRMPDFLNPHLSRDR
ncbi:hypothetical protein [Vibrio astriarenae]|uniref:hypothetical protein n=1 Tax=Vibrio astriarenae TaxID=1481923 RepID=UPI003736B88C